MQPSFVCPECRCVHAEPAEAAYRLAVLCLECEIAAEFHARERFAVIVAAAA